MISPEPKRIALVAAAAVRARGRARAGRPLAQAEEQPGRVPADTEALICQMRREHPRWGARRITYELGLQGPGPVPGRATLHRVPCQDPRFDRQPLALGSRMPDLLGEKPWAWEEPYDLAGRPRDIGYE